MADDARARGGGGNAHANAGITGNRHSWPPAEDGGWPPADNEGSEASVLREAMQTMSSINGAGFSASLAWNILSYLEEAPSEPADGVIFYQAGNDAQDVLLRRNKDKQVVYAAKLYLPWIFIPLLALIGLLMGGSLVIDDTCMRLGATKIGMSDSFADFLQKMRSLQTYIPFARIEWMAILVDRDAWFAEQAMHFVYRRFLIEGEWFDMSPARIADMLSRFPGCTVVYGRTNFHNLNPVHAPGAPAVPGNVYMARFDWPWAVRVAISIISMFWPDPNVQWVCQQMLATKIGSAGDMSSFSPGRGAGYIWACCFAEVRYVYMEHPTMRAQEQLLHNWKVHMWGGHGEWFCLFQADVAQILTYFTLVGVPFIPGLPAVHGGVWQRVGSNWHLTFVHIYLWILAGWVRALDVLLNYFSGFFTVGAAWMHWSTFIP